MSCEAIKILEKGVIFIVDKNIEGIVPTKNISNNIKENLIILE